MSLLVLRLAGSLQSWSGYRHQVNMNSSVPTQALPRKSAVNGLLGAALGPTDHGFGHARDLDAIGDRYTLQVRMDVTNPITEDFQVLGPLPPAAARRADAMGRLGSASTKEFRNNRRADGNFPTTVSRRDFLAHSEFMVALETDEKTAQAWLAALKDPVFMPYLGRKSCAPSFPFLLGIHPGKVTDLFAKLPWVSRTERRRAPEGKPGTVLLPAYEVTGDFDRHVASEHNPHYEAPVDDRAGQLNWAKENLSR